MEETNYTELDWPVVIELMQDQLLGAGIEAPTP